jgi:FAD/FMN-containing dehydrogenase
VSIGADSVTVGAGVSMDTLLSTLDLNGKGLAHHPAPGDITVAGALAIGGHGTAVKALGETMPPGHSHGSLPNLVQSLRAVVWDSTAGRYLAKTFTRSEREIGALLVHVGRAFITQVTLRIGPKQRMRCRSLVRCRPRAGRCLGQRRSHLRVLCRVGGSGRADLVPVHR